MPLEIDFNLLSRSVRERFVKSLVEKVGPAPLFVIGESDREFKALWVGIAAMAVEGLLIALGFGFGDLRAGVDGPAWVLVYGIAIYCAVFAVLSFRRLSRRSGLPFPPGRYVFPSCFVDARGRKLQVIPLMVRPPEAPRSDLWRVGWFSETEVYFCLGGRRTEVFRFDTRETGERLLRDLRMRQDELRKALERGDQVRVAELDVFAGLRSTGTWQLEQPEPGGPLAGPEVPVPSIARRRARTALAIAVLGLPAWLVRNGLSDEAMFREARGRDDAWSYRAYLDRGGYRHADEVRAALPRAAFARAVATGSVSALQAFLHDYPSSKYEEGARQAIHELFAVKRAAFRARSFVLDPAMAEFVERLLDFQETHSSPPVLVQFRTGRADEARKALEEAVIDGLRDSLVGLFPAGDRYGDEVARIRREDEGTGAGSQAAARFLITYGVERSGSVTAQEDGGVTRSVTGLSVSFRVELRIPDGGKPVAFDLTVRPREVFQVSEVSLGSRSLRRLAADLARNPRTAPDGSLDELMALCAFDRLDDRLREPFFPRPTPEVR